MGDDVGDSGNVVVGEGVGDVRCWLDNVGDVGGDVFGDGIGDDGDGVHGDGVGGDGVVEDSVGDGVGISRNEECDPIMNERNAIQYHFSPNNE